VANLVGVKHIAIDARRCVLAGSFAWEGGCNLSAPVGHAGPGDPGPVAVDGKSNENQRAISAVAGLVWTGRGRW